MGAGVGGLAAAPVSIARAASFDKASNQAWLQTILERYNGFGAKASGGPGDEACGAWLEETLKGWGYLCRRQPFEIPWFEARLATLATDGAEAPVIPQAIVAPTAAKGLTAPLRLASEPGDLASAIAIVVLPYKRWVALADPEIDRPLTDVFTRGAAAAILVSTGPTGEAVALNVSTRKPAFERPVAILAPKTAKPFLAAAAQGSAGCLIVDGQGGRRTAFNLIGHLDRKAAETIIISTPRSGWFRCAAERGSGVAVWLSLARWLAQTNHGVNIELLATSGHEYEYVGGELYLSEAPAPAVTKLWVHIGASAAARDWHELGPALLPLPSADSQRVLTATADILTPVRAAFRGISGLEATYIADQKMAGGELTNVLNARYKTAIGLYGGHRYFHTQGDDIRCVSADLVEPVSAAFRVAVDNCLRGARNVRSAPPEEANRG